MLGGEPLEHQDRLGEVGSTLAAGGLRQLALADHHGRHLAAAELGDEAAAGEPALAQHGDGVGVAQHLAELVGDHQDGQQPLLRHAAQQAEHLVGLVRGQHRGRLVEDQELPLQPELLEDLGLLLLAGGQLVDPGTSSGTLNGIRAMKASSAAPSWRQLITAGTSSRDMTRFSATVIDGTSVKCW